MCDAVGVDKPGSHVGPGESFTYTWQVLEGPSSSDSPCIPYLYYSAADPAVDTNSGLVGPLLVCKKGALGGNGTQVLLYYPFAHALSQGNAGNSHIYEALTRTFLFFYQMIAIDTFPSSR